MLTLEQYCENVADQNAHGKNPVGSLNAPSRVRRGQISTQFPLTSTQQRCCSRITVGRVAGSEKSRFIRTNPFEIAGVNASQVVARGGCCSPRLNFLVPKIKGKTVLGLNALNCLPRNPVSRQWVKDLNTIFSQVNAGTNKNYVKGGPKWVQKENRIEQLPSASVNRALKNSTKCEYQAEISQSNSSLGSKCRDSFHGVTLTVTGRSRNV